jgi:hypothetical protein
MRIMLAWSDAKGHGLGGSTPAWVNNLDLQVSARGERYLGNQIGVDGWSAVGGNAEDRNNLEAIYLHPEQHGGDLSIAVHAANIAADALNPYLPGEPAQDFALACYNCIALPQLGEANLGLSLAATPDPVNAGEVLTITADLHNRGPNEATMAVLRLRLPPQLSFESGARTDGAGTWSCAAVDSLVECRQIAGRLPVDSGSAISTLSISARVNLTTVAAMLEVTGEVDAPQYGDDNRADNQATLQSAVITETLLRDGFE